MKSGHVLIASDASFESETPPRIYTEKTSAEDQYFKHRSFLILSDHCEDWRETQTDARWQFWVQDADGHENESLILLFDVPVIEP